MRKLNEIFKSLEIKKRIVSAETIHGNMVFEVWVHLYQILEVFTEPLCETYWHRVS